MKYLNMTFSYLKKNFLLPTVAMLIPAVAACFLYTSYWEVSFVASFDFMPYKSAWQTFTIIFGDAWQYVWPVVIVSALQIVGAAIIMSAVDRHFRTGSLSLKSPVRLINISVFPIAIGVAVMSLTAIVLRLLLFGLVSLVQVIFDTLSVAPGAALAVISAIAVVLFFLHTLIIIPMLMWAPIMFIYGYKFRDAAAMSFKLISGKKLFYGLFLPMSVCAGLQLLVGFLDVHVAISCAVDFVIFLFTNVYATVYIMIAFYDISDLERRDIAPYKRTQFILPTEEQKPGEQPQQERSVKPAPAEKKKSSKGSQKGEGKQSAKEGDNVL